MAEDTLKGGTMAKVVRRTFEAAKYPKGSPERAELNKSWRTSEYMTSHRYGVEGTPFTFRTKQEAEAKNGG